jgi:hypothetical protein
MNTDTDWVADVRRWCLANPKAGVATSATATEAGEAGASKVGHESAQTTPSSGTRPDAPSYPATGPH